MSSSGSGVRWGLWLHCSACLLVSFSSVHLRLLDSHHGNQTLQQPHYASQPLRTQRLLSLKSDKCLELHPQQTKLGSAPVLEKCSLWPKKQCLSQPGLNGLAVTNVPPKPQWLVKRQRFMCHSIIMWAVVDQPRLHPRPLPPETGTAGAADF